MARKKAKAPARKSAKPAKRSAAKSKPAAPARSAQTWSESTGKGASAGQIGADLVALFNANKAQAVEKKWASPDMAVVEGSGHAFTGAALHKRNEEWYKTTTLLGGSAEGPYVGATGFSVKFRLHTRDNASGKESTMEEIGVYTVRDGRIVREEFMYGS